MTDVPAHKVNVLLVPVFYSLSNCRVIASQAPMSYSAALGRLITMFEEKQTAISATTLSSCTKRTKFVGLNLEESGGGGEQDQASQDKV